ncbi:MAG: AraC family transcriptional regulator [Burkholderiales bacterium]
MAIPRLLEERGIDHRRLLEESGLAHTLFDDSENTLSIAEGARLLRLGAERAACPHFGLLVGQNAPAQSMGALGYLMLSSPTVGDALAVLAQHLGVHDRGSVVAMRVEDRFAIMSYSTLDAGVESPDQVHALSIALGRNIMRALCGPAWKPAHVTFAFKRPIDMAPYRQCFGVTPAFDAAESALVFPARQLAQTLPGADAMLNRLMKQRVEAQSFAADEGLVDNVRRLLRASLPAAVPSLTEVAERMGVHARTLERQLASRGTTFRRVREELVHDVARELLEETSMPLAQIASTLGYSEAASFTRAFARRSGVPPLKWRVARTRTRPADEGAGPASAVAKDG